MKKALLSGTLLFGLSLLSPVSAQRHVKNISAWGVHYGRTEKGEFYEGSYLHYLTDKVSFRISGLREFANLEEMGKYAAFSSRVFLSPQLFRFGEVAYFHLLLGGVGSYERTWKVSPESEGEKLRRNRFIYGPQAGLEVDSFVNKRVSFVTTGIKGKLFNRPLLDEWPGSVAMGLRYHFR